MEHLQMWACFWKMLYNENPLYRYGPPALFVDQQSFVDNTVVVAQTLYYHLEGASEEALKLLEDVPEPSTKGFAYGWIPGRDAHNVYANLEIANMDCRDFSKAVRTRSRSSSGPIGRKVSQKTTKMIEAGTTVP